MAKKEEPKNEVLASAPAGAVATTMGMDFGTFGLDSTLSSDNILIPKLLLMQGLSDLVAAEKAQMGDLVNSLTEQIVGSCREKDFRPVTFLPIMAFETWGVNQFIKKDGKEIKDWVGTVPFSSANADWPREGESLAVAKHFGMEPDTKFQCVRELNFYVMLDSECDDPMALPYMLKFKSTSYRVGMKLATHFAQCQRATQLGKPTPPASYLFKLSGTKETNDQGTFFVLSLEPAGRTSQEHLKVAYDWYQILVKNKDKVVVDNRDEEKTAPATSAPPRAEKTNVDASRF
jgi:hypothetical protein